MKRVRLGVQGAKPPPGFPILGPQSVPIRLEVTNA